MSKNNLTEAELTAKAIKEVFPYNPKADKLIATSDGHFFLPWAKSQALNHAKENGLKTYEIEKTDASSKKTSNSDSEAVKAAKAQKKAEAEAAKVEEQNLIININTAESAEAVDALIAEGEKRENVLEAVKSKKAELEALAAEKILGKTKSEWAEATVAEVGELVKTIEDAEVLTQLKIWVDTKGGDAHIDARLKELEEAAKASNPDLNHKA